MVGTIDVTEIERRVRRLIERAEAGDVRAAEVLLAAVMGEELTPEDLAVIARTLRNLRRRPAQTPTQAHGAHGAHDAVGGVATDADGCSRGSALPVRCLRSGGPVPSGCSRCTRTSTLATRPVRGIIVFVGSLSSGFEQGPIRPPSEAQSLLVRVSRNCAWNRCAFCPVYKGQRFSPRGADEVLGDLDAMREVFGDRPRTVFLQDANPLLTRTDDLVRIVAGIRDRFPHVTRVTAYARTHTLARRPLAELKRIRAAGLDRLHVGLESGCDEVLTLVRKGVTRAQQIEGGHRAREAGFDLSVYVMPGLGGRALSAAHADDTATALAAIQPDFVRLRTTAFAPGTPLAEMQARGELVALSEGECVHEIRRLLSGLAGVTARLESDHVLNLLMELRGDLSTDLDLLLAICDRFLGMPEPGPVSRTTTRSRILWEQNALTPA